MTCYNVIFGIAMFILTIMMVIYSLYVDFPDENEYSETPIEEVKKPEAKITRKCDPIDLYREEEK